MRRNQAISLEQATQDSPTLARLSELVRESSARLRAIEPLIPPAMRQTVQAGPLDGAAWCLLVSSSASAAKLRQLLPEFLAVLRTKGLSVDSIRLKIHAR